MPEKRVEAGLRREALREILRQGGAADHETLVDALAGRGFEVTQSSVSRDLRALGAAKAEGRWVLAEAIGGGDWGSGSAPTSLVTDAVREVLPAGSNLLVIRTAPAQAGAVGMSIDRARWPGVAGTVAGDDTVFVAVDGPRTLAAVRARLLAETRGRQGRDRPAS